MKFKVSVFFLASVFYSFTATAQVSLFPLRTNPQIKQYLAAHPDYTWNSGRMNKWGTPDTVQLPFFDDFSQHHIYPDSSKWQNNMVYINSDLPIRPPTYGVATFDFLDPSGNPYSPLEEDRIGPGDTLTSQFIDLGGLTVADSVIMTFFFQAKGNGDFTTEKDSLKLQFKLTDSTWTKVWATGGGTYSAFQKVSIAIRDTSFLKNNFQFRFSNTTYHWGNNNHWHLDYVFINKDRTFNDLDFPDYAIQTKPTSLLKNYYAMPYDHFMANPASEASEMIYFRVSNRSDTRIAAEVRHVELWESNVLVSTPFDTNTANIPAEGSALRRIKSYDFTGLTGDTVIIDRNYYVKEVGITNPFLYQRNDSIHVQQRFENFFAMDDGTAESSFGFNDLRNATGTMAVRFRLNVPDTLRAVNYFFTPNIDDPSRYLITLKIWKSIAFDGGITELLWDSTILLPDFSTDGFGNKTFYPGPIALPAGDFYVGWEQSDNFNMSIGFDKNDGYRDTAARTNKDIFYNVGTGWIQNTNKLLAGAPMIRVFVGSEIKMASVPAKPVTGLDVYPVPARDVLHVQNVNDGQWTILDLTGKRVLEGKSLEAGRINVSTLGNGLYFLAIESEGVVYNRRILISR